MGQALPHSLVVSKTSSAGRCLGDWVPFLCASGGPFGKVPRRAKAIVSWLASVSDAALLAMNASWAPYPEPKKELRT